MKDAPGFPDELITQSTSFFETLVQQVPAILGGLLALLLGWLLARLARALVVKALGMLNRFLDRLLSGQTRAVVRFSSGVTQLIANLVFWVIIFVFVTIALRMAGLSAIASWLERIVDYLPTLLTGALIIFLGYVLSSVVRDAVFTTARSAGLAEAELLSRLAWAVTLITGLIIGLDQVGVDITFITIMLGVVAGTLLGGFALAFGLGSKTLVSNLIAAHYLRELVEPGQRISIAGVEGRVLDVSATVVVVETSEGRVSIPAKEYQEQAFTVILEDADDD